ncbi:MAG: RNA polymerase sigma-70 factor [Sphingobacteriaceae bacterium]|nr:RNA polymerase sigma-70 factor [Cytophagaceae bacterium]
MNDAYPFQSSLPDGLPSPRPVDSTEPIRTDPEWAIRRALATNPTLGFDLLYRRYYGPLCSHATRLVYARDVAEDLVTELFVRLWQQQDYQRVTGSFRAYLFTAVRNRAINYLRWEQGHTERLDVTAPDNQLPGPLADDPLAFEELAQQVHQAVGTLPPQCRNVFLLSRFEGKKNREIADELRISLKTVEGHLTKALAQVRLALRSYWCLLVLGLWS